MENTVYRQACRRRAAAGAQDQRLGPVRLRHADACATDQLGHTYDVFACRLPPGGPHSPDCRSRYDRAIAAAVWQRRGRRICPVRGSTACARCRCRRSPVVATGQVSSGAEDTDHMSGKEFDICWN